MRKAPEIREDFVDPAEVWDPQMTSPIPKIIGGLLAIAITLGIVAWGVGYFRGLAFLPLICIGYGLGQIVPSAQRLRAYLRYEAWMASPQPAPNHLGSIAAGSLLTIIGVVEIGLIFMVLFAQ